MNADTGLPGAAPDAGGVAADAPGWNLDNDALAHALSWLTRHHGRERSVESLLTAQPVNGPLEPKMALRVLREAGYSAGLLERRLDELHALLLPAVPPDVGPTPIGVGGEATAEDDGELMGTTGPGGPGPDEPATLQTLREPDPTKARPDSKRRRSTEPDTKRARHG